MPSTLADCYAALQEEVTLPVSGLVFLLRKPDSAIFMGLGELPIPQTPAPDGTGAPAQGLSPRDVLRYTERMLAEGVVTPTLSDARDDQGAAIYSPRDYIHVCMLHPGDRDFLATKLMAKLGLTPEVATNIQAFRQDEERPAGESPGAGIQRVAERDSEVHVS